jgi:hypothetical protein
MEGMEAGNSGNYGLFWECAADKKSLALQGNTLGLQKSQCCCLVNGTLNAQPSFNFMNIRGGKFGALQAYGLCVFVSVCALTHCHLPSIIGMSAESRPKCILARLIPLRSNLNVFMGEGD